MNVAGNLELVDYGIQTEESQIRVHVCPLAERVYVYPTECGVKAVKSGLYRKSPGYQDGVQVPTAMGYVVPPDEIEKCIGISFRPSVWRALQFSEDDTLTEKGRKAVHLIMEMLREGLFPIGALGQEITAKDVQIKGTDIIIKAGAIAQRDLIIQVKCDYRGGPKELGGTGNLFLQVAECNPFKYS
jgi:hypothetical protein